MGSSGSTQRNDASSPQHPSAINPSTSSSHLRASRDRSRSPTNSNSSPTRLRSRTQSFRSTMAPWWQNDVYSPIGRQDHPSSPPPPRASADTSEEGMPEQEDLRLPLVPTQSSRQLPPPQGHPARPAYLSRQRLRMSRLGTRFLPDPVIEALRQVGEETEREGQALRRGRPRSNNYYRFLRDSINQRTGRTESGRQPLRAPFSSASPEHRSLHERNSTNPREQADLPPELFATSTHSRRGGRFDRFRNSLAAPLQGLFHRSNSQAVSSNTPSTGQSRPRNTDDADHLLPPLTGIDHRVDSDEPPHELDAVEPETRNVLSPSRITQGMSTIRRFPHGLRSRSTRLIRRGEHPPLSQVLQLAAAAIAAQLSGTPYTSATGGRPFHGDAFDGSIQNFVQTLQEAASAQAGENIDLNAPDADLPPVNFMRVFQFPNDENGAPITSQAQAHNPDTMDVDNVGQNGDGDRSVTLVLVGVRSMPNTSDGPNENGTIGPSLDTLLSLPFLPPTNILRNGSSGALFRRSDNRTRDNSRRHSMTNFSSAGQSARTSTGTTTPSATNSAVDASLHTPLSAIQSDSPPGPHPPPSTPADMRSGYATPIRRPSSASGVHPTDLASPNDPSSSPPVTMPASQNPFLMARQRRRSDSEFARRPELSSGAARRNGVVEPDHPPSSPNSAGRSWLIYVVGTNVSSDHPAFTMPSLFTDNPSYEDMQMLSTLLGPVKPPVASQSDVTSAGGVYRLRIVGNEFVADPITTADTAVQQPAIEREALTLGQGERCLICLCDYEATEEVRKLTTCQHIYHRECIDEVSIFLLPVFLLPFPLSFPRPHYYPSRKPELC